MRHAFSVPQWCIRKAVEIACSEVQGGQEVTSARAIEACERTSRKIVKERNERRKRREKRQEKIERKVKK